LPELFNFILAYVDDIVWYINDFLLDMDVVFTTSFQKILGKAINDAFLFL